MRGHWAGVRQLSMNNNFRYQALGSLPSSSLGLIQHPPNSSLPSLRAQPPSPPCSLLSLLRGRSRLRDTTDSVSVSGSRFSRLLDTVGLGGQGWCQPKSVGQSSKSLASPPKKLGFPPHLPPLDSRIPRTH